MKNTVITICILLFSVLTNAQQGKVLVDSFKVDGNCDMCKKRIEDAAYVKGVKRAEWSKSTQQLVLFYKSDKTSILKIAEQVALAGHSNEKVKAKEEDYKKLPECCHYLTTTCEH